MTHDPSSDVLARLRSGEVLGAAELGLASPFVDDALGLVIDEIAVDRVTGHLDADVEHHQPFGLVHGGVWSAVVETLCSIGASLQLPDGGQAVGVHNATDIVRPHRMGRVEAIARPIHVGRGHQLWETEIRRASDGALLARGQLRLQNLPGQRAHVSPPGGPDPEQAR